MQTHNKMDRGTLEWNRFYEYITSIECYVGFPINHLAQEAKQHRLPIQKYGRGWQYWTQICGIILPRPGHTDQLLLQHCAQNFPLPPPPQNIASVSTSAMLYATTRVAVAAVESNPSLSKPVHTGGQVAATRRGNKCCRDYSPVACVADAG